MSSTWAIQDAITYRFVKELRERASTQDRAHRQ